MPRTSVVLVLKTKRLTPERWRGGLRLILKRSFNIDNTLRAFEYVRVSREETRSELSKFYREMHGRWTWRGTREIARMKYDEIRVLDRPSSSTERFRCSIFAQRVSDAILRVNRSRYKISPRYVRVGLILFLEWSSCCIVCTKGFGRFTTRKNTTRFDRTKRDPRVAIKELRN